MRNCTNGYDQSGNLNCYAGTYDSINRPGKHIYSLISLPKMAGLLTSLEETLSSGETCATALLTSLGGGEQIGEGSNGGWSLPKVLYLPVQGSFYVSIAND